LKLYYYLFILLIYIDEKSPLFIPSKVEILVPKNFNFFVYEEVYNFLCGRPRGAAPPIHMCPLEPDSSPLRVDVINGWPFIPMLPFNHSKMPMAKVWFCNLLVIKFWLVV